MSTIRTRLAAGRMMPAALGRDVLSGGVVALVCVAYSVSFAALIFSGPLAAGLPQGLGSALLSAGLCALVVSALSGFRMVVAAPDTPAVAVMAAMAPALAAAVSVAGRSDLAVPTVLVTLSLTALLTGALLCALGVFRLGVWMRFIPYPVVGGFLAASGTLLCLGAIRLMTGIAPTAETITLLAEPALLSRLLMGAGLGMALFAMQRRWNHFLIVPGTLLAGTAVTHGILAFTGMSLGDAQNALWLLAPATGGTLWPPIDGGTLGKVDWGAILGQAAEIAAVAGVTAITILLNSTGLEVQMRAHADIDREFRTGGLANLLAGAAGAMPGNISLNRSLLNVRAGATGRASGIVAGVLCLAVPFAGPGFIGYIPTPVLGGLLLYLGASMLDTWLVKSRKRLTWAEYLLVATILYLIVDRGYLEGAALGVVASCLFFAINYSRVRVVKQALTRAEYGSYVERSAHENRVLRQHGDLIQILWLQGYLFFGTANSLFDDIRERFHHRPRADERWLVLDFKAVTGIDSSAVFSFIKLRQFAEEERLTLVLCELPEAVRQSLQSQGVFAGGGPRIEHFPNLDQALEWCEDRLLARHLEEMDSVQEIEGWLAGEIGDIDRVRRFIGFLERETFAPGETLFHQGEAADSVYFVLSGRVSVVLEQKGGGRLRLRSMLGQTVVGEMGLYRDTTRSASVVVEEAAVVYRLDRAALDRMSRDAPDVVGAFHSMIVRTLADRLSFANNEIAALQR